MFLEVTMLMCFLSSSNRQETDQGREYHSTFYDIRGFFLLVETDTQFIISISKELIACLGIFQPAS